MKKSKSSVILAFIKSIKQLKHHFKYIKLKNYKGEWNMKSLKALIVGVSKYSIVKIKIYYFVKMI